MVAEDLSFEILCSKVGDDRRKQSGLGILFQPSPLVGGRQR